MSSPHVIPLSDETREQVAGLLNRALAEEFALAAAARDYHWNVSGPQFRNLHELFGQQYHELDQWIERLGEQARTLGVIARTSWTELTTAPQLRPARGADLNAACMLAELTVLHDQVAGWLRSAAGSCGDPATVEVVAELVEYHETSAWMLGELLEDRQLAQV